MISKRSVKHPYIANAEFRKQQPDIVENDRICYTPEFDTCESKKRLQIQ